MAGLGDSTRIRDFAEAAIVDKTVHLTEDQGAELARCRKQIPPQWHALAGNPEEAKDELWEKHLRPGIWLKVVFEGGDVLMGQVLKMVDGQVVCFDRHTTLLNEETIGDYELSGDERQGQQVFTDDQEIADRVKKERYQIRFPD